MLLYQTFAERRYSSDAGEYIAYGLKVSEIGAEISARVLISDISTCKEKVDALAAKFNIHQLSLLHLNDVIEDEIA